MSDLLWVAQRVSDITRTVAGFPQPPAEAEALTSLLEASCPHKKNRKFLQINV